MVQPHELKLNLPMEISNGMITTQQKSGTFFWQVKMATWKELNE